MQRFSRLWWLSILMSSAVMGGGSFLLLNLLTDLETLTVAKISVALILAGDVVLALVMEAVSPTHVKIGPGERRHHAELPQELGKVVSDFENRHGRVSIRGETWRARQTPACSGRLEPGTPVRVVAREGLTLVVTAADEG